jgi:hypothetical protein
VPAGNTYEAIATTTASGGESSIDFTSIPTTYTDLVILANISATTAYEFFMRFNSDSGTNYSVIGLEGNGTTPSSFRETNSPRANTGYSPSTNPTPIIINLQNYANTTTYKNYISRSSPAAGSVIAYAGIWSSTAAITSISFTLTTAKTFNAGTVISLYGIKAA